MMIGSNNSVPLPSVLENESLEGRRQGDRHRSTLSQMSLFICSCRLFEVLYDILSIFYIKDTSKQGPLVLTSTEVDDCITNVLRLNKRIDMLEADLPDELRVFERNPNVFEPRNNVIYLQQQIYYCR